MSEDESTEFQEKKARSNKRKGADHNDRKSPQKLKAAPEIFRHDSSDQLLAKREKPDDDDDDFFTSENLSKMSRSERKRHREKKRRSDVNKGFDDLMALLIDIDPGVRAEADERARRGQFKGSAGALEDNLLSRVDLISRTVEVLRRVHRENEENKLIIKHLTNTPSQAASMSDSIQNTLRGSLQHSLQGANILGSQLSDPVRVSFTTAVVIGIETHISNLIGLYS